MPRLPQQRWARIALAATGSLLAVLLLVVAGGWLYLQADPGRRWVASMLGGLVEGPDRKLTVSKLTGTLPFHPRIDVLTLSDAGGVWLTVRDVQLDLVPASLLGGTARLTAATVGSIEMARQPLPQAKTDPGETRVALPKLPIAVAIERLLVDRIALAPPVLGEPVLLHLEGSGDVRAQLVRLQLALTRGDGIAGGVTLSAQNDSGGSAIELRIDEPTGRVLASSLGRSEPVPLQMTLSGKGPDDNWRGTLKAAAGGGDPAALDLKLAIDRPADAGTADERRLGITGVVGPGALVRPDLAQAIGGPANVDAAIRLRPDGVWWIERGKLATRTASLEGAFRGAAGSNPVSGNVAMRLPDLAAFAGLLSPGLAGAAALDATIEGTGAAPRVRGRVTGTNLRAPSLSAGSLVADLDGTRGAADGLYAGKLEIRIDDLHAGELSGAMTISAAGTTDRDLRALQLQRLAIDGLGAKLLAEGSGKRDGSAAGKATLEIADLAVLAPLAGRPLGGGLSLRADLANAAGGTKGVLSGEARGVRTGIPSLDALLEPVLSLAAEAAYGPAGAELSKLSLKTGRAQLGGDLNWKREGGRLGGSLVADIRDVGHVRPGLDGNLHATIGIGGSVAVPEAQLKADLSGGKLQAQAVAAVVQRNGGTAIDAHVTGAGSEVEAKLTLAPSGRADGTVRVNAPDLAPWSPFVGVLLGGSANLDATLRATPDQQAQIKLRGNNLRAGTTAVQKVTLDADLQSLDIAPSGRGSLLVENLVSGETKLVSAQLTLRPQGARQFAFDAAATGTMNGPLRVSAAGSLRTEPAARSLTLSRLDGELIGKKLSLARAATLAQRGDGAELSDLRLDWGTAQLNAAGTLRGDTAAARATLRGLRVADLAKLGDVRGSSGVIELDAELSGSRQNPRGRAVLSLAELKLAAASRPDAKPLALRLQADLAAGRVQLDGTVTGTGDAGLRLTGGLPLQLNLLTYQAALPPAGALSLRLAGAGTLEDIADLLPIGEDRVEGRYDVDLRVDGTVAQPQAGGRVAISNGRYINQASDAEIAEATIELAGDRDRLQLQRFTGTDRQGGRAELTGAVDLSASPSPKLDFTARLTGFHVAKRDDATVAADGELHLTGDLRHARIDGKVTTRAGAELRIPERLPPSIATIQVIEIDSRLGQRVPAKTEKPPVFVLDLDLGLSVPGRAFVRGRGLDSEWEGNLQIGGTTATPILAGQFRTVRGQLALLGRDFTLTKGEISFDGTAEANPRLDIVAEATTDDITAQALIGGRAKAPTVKFTATPALPQDEVLARILFNKGVGAISPIQGLQLAAAARELAGGGGTGGILDKLRKGIGLDRLDVGAGENGRATGTTVSGGRYITDKVYVGVEQGTGGDAQTKARVEIEVRPSISVESTFGAGAGSGVGIQWKRDY